MKQTNNPTASKIDSGALSKRMLLGGTIALVLISLLLFTVKNPDPAWPKYWKVRPLVIVPIAGAMGGLFYYLMGRYRNMGGWIKVIAFIVSIIGFVFALWIGTILGLDGTLWN